MTGILGCSRRKSWSSSSPPRPGRLMSTRATSQACFSTAASAWRASAASTSTSSGKALGENAAQAPAEQFVIIHYEDAGHSSAQNFVSLAARGKRSVTRVPLG